MTPECVLLICLDIEESKHIQQLLASFDIEISSKDICSIDEIKPVSEKVDVCLIVLKANEYRRIDQEIRQLRRFFHKSIPILILIPPDLTSNIKQYIHDGADDYWILPFDNTAFSVRFYVLLEYGQAVSISQKPKPLDKKLSYDETSLLRRILDKIQDSVNFFSPRQLYKYENNYSIAKKWTKIRKLGFGGFGEVWLVRRQEKGISAVAKIPHSPKLNIRSLRSAAILKRLSFHPNVVHLIEVVEESGKVILIQEYVQGFTLQELLEKDMRADQKEKAFLQLLKVTAYAHQHKIMHRDIKPENIIITHSGNLKLLDFGIAKDLSSQTFTRTVAGSRPFMAPEQIMGKSSLTSDVWALGVILYLMATKCLPFYHDNEKYLMDMILDTPPLPPRNLVPDLSEKFESIILKCLNKKTENRYNDANQLQKALIKNFPDFGNGEILFIDN